MGEGIGVSIGCDGDMETFGDDSDGIEFVRESLVDILEVGDCLRVCFGISRLDVSKSNLSSNSEKLDC